ncbi:MAG: hypothetical protein LBT74_06930 [Acidobacteriota bacterium]|nr:hypothetical protein [Acidobacteriota bacterium]
MADGTEDRTRDESRVQEPAGGDEDEISILDLLLVLAGGKKLIIGLTLACGVLAGVLAFITPKSYTASALIMPPQQGTSSAAAMLGQLGGLAGGLLGGAGVSTPADAYIGILKSRTVSDEVIGKFKLQELYKTKTQMATRGALAQRTNFETTDAGLIQISFTDRTPERAAEVANAYVEILREQNSRLALTESSQRRLFFERQLEEEKDKLAAAEGELLQFQMEQGIVQADSQMDAVFTTMVELRAQITKDEADLESLLAGATPQNPEVLRQQASLQAKRARLRQLESKNASRSKDDPLLPTSMMPEAGMEYARRLRDVKYRESLYELLAKQYEAARMDEAQESPVIQVVDVAVPPDWKSAPKRSLYVLAGLLFGCMMGVFVVFLRHALNDPAHAGQIAELKALLWFKAKK